MKKLIIVASTALTFTATAQAQGTSNASSTATQTVQLNLSNALDISFTGNGFSPTGPVVTLPFTSTDDYANGVESQAQELRVRSNRNFNVSVKTSATTFSIVNGGLSSSSLMPASVLSAKVSLNNTGGSVAGSFANYTSLSQTGLDLITGATNGGNKTFSVQYKAQPGFDYAAGSYAIDVIYTATQP